MESCSELDRWILSELNSLIKTVDEAYADYEPTRAGRAIQYFVNEHLSNWYVRLSRRRFWKGSYSEDKIQAYQTLYRCLEVVAQLAAPIAPFYAERLFKDLNDVSGRIKAESVHLTDFPVADEKQIDKSLEERMELAQKISSMILSLRKKTNIRVRQPLNKAMIPVLDARFQKQVQAVEDLILSETNIKQIEYITGDSDVLVKKIKPDFKTLGPKYGKIMKQLAGIINSLGQEEIRKLENEEILTLDVNGQPVEISKDDVEITTRDIPGWSVISMDDLTVALDITITGTLKDEGLARELVNRIQNMRKEMGLEVTDRISLQIVKTEATFEAFQLFKDYICTETLADLALVETPLDNGFEVIDLTEGASAKIKIEKRK